MKRPTSSILYLLLFGVLVAANNCGGGGGGGGAAGGSSTGTGFLDQISSNQVQVTSLESASNTILGNVALILTEEGNELARTVAQTNESGTYTFGGVKIGAYTLRAVKPGYNEAALRVVVTDGPQKVQIRLSASFPPTSISGQVSDISNDAPISDVVVEILDVSPLISARSGADGVYTLRDVPPGNYTIKASKTGYATQERSNVLKNPNIAVTGVDFELSRSSTSEIKIPGKIRGIVKDTTDGQPLQGVTVQLKGAALGSTTTDQQGYFNFDNVESDITYILTAFTTAPARKGAGSAVVQQYYQTYTFPNASTGSGQITIFEVPMTPVPEPAVPQRAELVGTVYDSVTKNPLELVQVEAVGTSFRATTNASGSFSMTGVSAGIEYIFLFSKAGYFTKTTRQILAVGYNILAPDARLELDPLTSTRNKATIVGTVRDDYSGALLPGVTVSVLGTALSVTTDSSGAYILSDIPVPNATVTGQPATANITLLYAKDGYRSVTLRRDVEGGKTIQADPQELVRMKGSIVITVYDSKTQSRIDGANVSFQGFTPQSGAGSQNTSGGRVTFNDIPLGTYNFTITQDQYATATLTGVVITQDYQTVNASAYLNRDIVNVEGYVYNEVNGIAGYQSGPGGDLAVPGVQVTVRSESGQVVTTGQAFALTNGYYRISNLPVGVRFVVTTSQGQASANYRFEEREVTMLVGTNRLDIGLYKLTGSITGFVFQDDNRDGVWSNEPKISGATVTVTNLTLPSNNGEIVTSGTTDSQGRFLIENVKAGQIKIEVSRPEDNYQTTFKVVQMIDGASIADVAIPMILQNTSISGQVFDGATNRPIQGALVSVVGHAGITATTDANGSYRLDSVPLTPANKILLFDATAKGYGIATAGTTVTAGQATILEQPTRLFRTTRYVYGAVVDAVSGAAVSGIQVTLTYSEGTAEIATAVTSASGGFVFPAVTASDAATVTLEFKDLSTQVNGKPRYAAASRSLTVAPGDTPLKLTPDVALQPNFTVVRGFVYERAFNAPLNLSRLRYTPGEDGDPDDRVSYVKVIIPETGQSAEVSLVNGEFAIKNVPAGENYTLKAYHHYEGNEFTRLFPDAVKGIATASAAETYTGILYVSLEKTNLYGSVADDLAHFPTGTPAITAWVPGATVTATISGVPGFSASATVDGNGSFLMKVPPADNYIVTVSAAGFATQTRLTNEIVLNPGGERMDFRLVPKTGTVTGTIYIDENRNGVLDAGDRRVDASSYIGTLFTVHFNYKGKVYQTQSRTDGTYRLENVPVGERYIEFSPLTTGTDLSGGFWQNPADSSDLLVGVAESGTDPTAVDLLARISAAPTGRIYGHVYNSFTNLGVPGVTIKAFRSTDHGLVATTTSDDYGFFVFASLPFYTDMNDSVEIFLLQFTKNGYRTISSTKYTNSVSGQVEDIRLGFLPDGTSRLVIDDMTATMTQNAGNISGRVYDAGTGAPVSAANVRIAELPGALATTDALGVYDFRSVANLVIRGGVYTVIVAAANYATATVPGVAVVDDGQEVVLDVPLSGQYGNISGYLYEEKNGIPGFQPTGANPDLALGGQNVSYAPQGQAAATPVTIVTDQNGYYAITNLPVGYYSFSFGAAGDADAEPTHSPVTRVINIPDGANLSENVALTSLNGAFSGRVYEDVNGNGVRDAGEPYLSGITVGDAVALAAQDLTGATSTDGNGYFYLPLAVGTVNVRVTGQSLDATGGGTTVSKYYDKTIIVTVKSGVTQNQEIGLLTKKGRIAGRVIDSNTSKPVAGVKVLVSGTNLVTLTDANGEYALTNVPILTVDGDTYTLVFDLVSGGYQLTEASITRPTESESNYRHATVALTPRLRNVSGRIVNALTLDGIYDASAEVKLYDGSILGAKSDQAGYFTIIGVPVKTYEDYTLTAYHNEYETKLVDFHLGPGDALHTLSPDVALQSRRGDIKGRVIERTTNWPIQNSSLVLQASVTGFAKAANDTSITDVVTVDNDGYFTLRNIPRGGPYTVKIEALAGPNSFYMKDVIRSVSVTAGQTTNMGVIYAYLTEIPVKGAVLDQGAYVPLDMNVTSQLYRDHGVNGATVTFTHIPSGYTRTVTTNYVGSFEVQLPAIDFRITAVKTDYSDVSIIRDFAVDSTPVQILINPLMKQEVRGKVYYDANGNGYRDVPGEELIYNANGGLMQGFELRVYYVYRGATRSVEVLPDSSFVFNHVPVGSHTFFVSGPDFKTHYWMDSTGRSTVTVTTTATDPAVLDIAIRQQDSAFGTLKGVCRDWKIWVEAWTLFNTQSPLVYNRERANWQVPGLTVKAKSGTYEQTTTVGADGLWHLLLPTGYTGGREYMIELSDPRGLYQSMTTGPVLIERAASGGTRAKILADNGWLEITNLEMIVPPRMGRIQGTVYYDNNLNGTWDPQVDYNGIPQPAQEFPVNAVVGHPMRGCTWTDISFEVYYNYRGLTFGTTYYNRGSSMYQIDRVPVGTYGQSTSTAQYDHNTLLYCVDYNRDLGTWDSIKQTNYFRDVYYTLDGKKPAPFTVSENATTFCDFATYVHGGNLIIAASYEYQQDVPDDPTASPPTLKEITNQAPIEMSKISISGSSLKFDIYPGGASLVDLYSYPYETAAYWLALGFQEPQVFPAGSYFIVIDGIVSQQENSYILLENPPGSGTYVIVPPGTPPNTPQYVPAFPTRVGARDVVITPGETTDAVIDNTP